MSEDIVFVPNARSATILIDACEADRVLPLRWDVALCGGRFQCSRTWAIHGVRYYALLHRFILDAPDGLFVDHINGNPLDNRRSNLRLATHKENCRNTTARSHNVSGYKGVSPITRSKINPWRAQIRVDGQHYHLGNFPTAEVAAKAYDEAARRFFGEFAAVNFPSSGERCAALHGANWPRG